MESVFNFELLCPATLIGVHTTFMCIELQFVKEYHVTKHGKFQGANVLMTDFFFIYKDIAVSKVLKS